MIADGSPPLPDPDLAGIDSATDLADLGTVHLDPATDIDGDGVGELLSVESDRGLVVLGDHDHDGVAERLTVVDDGGRYASWEFCTAEDGSTRWERTNSGAVSGN